MARPALSRPVALAVTAVLTLAGCSGSGGSASPDAPDDLARSQVLQPGRPGEPNQTLPADATVASAPFNDADAAFMSMMIPHHAQALEMAELAETRAADEAVLSLARRIHGAQGPEIRSMAAWLDSRGLEVPGEGDHDHGDHEMAGMLTPEQMAELAAAEGEEFDRLFLAGMIQHHRGAVDMAAEELENGSDLLALELAADISTGQLAEIGRMQDLRRTL